MQNKEAYTHIMPHFQQPGQAYFVTFCLWNAIPRGALSNYTNQLREFRWRIDNRKKHQLYDRLLKDLENDYSRTRRHYFNAFDRLMAQNTDRTIDLNQTELAAIITGGLTFWQGTRIENYAWCIMPNHVHWVFKTWEKDRDGNPVYLSDIMESVKEHTAEAINRVIGREGQLWHEESFDTILRDDKHLYRAIEHTINNPVKAKYVDDRDKWPGTWGSGGL